MDLKLQLRMVRALEKIASTQTDIAASLDAIAEDVTSIRVDVEAFRGLLEEAMPSVGGARSGDRAIRTLPLVD